MVAPSFRAQRSAAISYYGISVLEIATSLCSSQWRIKQSFLKSFQVFRECSKNHFINCESGIYPCLHAPDAERIVPWWLQQVGIKIPTSLSIQQPFLTSLLFQMAIHRRNDGNQRQIGSCARSPNGSRFHWSMTSNAINEAVHGVRRPASGTSGKLSV